MRPPESGTRCLRCAKGDVASQRSTFGEKSFAWVRGAARSLVFRHRFRGDFQASRVHRAVCCTGGLGGARALDSVEVFDATRNSWSEGGLRKLFDGNGGPYFSAPPSLLKQRVRGGGRGPHGRLLATRAFCCRASFECASDCSFACAVGMRRGRETTCVGGGGRTKHLRGSPRRRGHS